ncbi:hypothetical protein AGMMS50212_07090 [Spirochaetia bacterium]|nr:hypothetical protein AGMMS50212_07020 [Spirochaetia bacterium]GHV83369.1 hypothetical protein AGMMS50212_07090 [Spirochaetia bacterium]
MDFSTLELHPDLQRALAEAGYQSAMPVQEQVIANAFSGRDLYVQSQTGTGKTAAYLIIIFQRLLTEPLLNGRKALIMVPTRELAVQVEDEAKLIGKYLPFKTGSFYGGVGYGAQQQLLRDDAQLMVGTPGRVLDLNASGSMNLMDIAFLILDEADRMFDMGFYPDLRKLIKVVPPADRRQTMLFSATLNSYVKNLAWEYTKEPVEIEIESENITVNEIDQMLYHVPASDKFKLLLGVFQNEKPESAIIFCNTKRYTETVARRLRANGIKAEFISGDLPQNKRLKIIDDFKAGKVRFLVATDVAARGLDIEALSLVVNFDLPNEKENYVHRIGRTARAGKTGKAITLVSEQDVYELSGIEKFIEQKIPSVVAGTEMYGDDKGEKEWKPGNKGRRGAQREGESGRVKVNREKSGYAAPPRSVAAPRSTTLPPRSSMEASARAKGSKRNKEQGENTNPYSLPTTHSKDVSGLSFEKRMAYYKEKYAGEKGTPTSGEKNDKKNRKTKKEIGQNDQNISVEQREDGGTNQNGEDRKLKSKRKKRRNGEKSKEQRVRSSEKNSVDKNTPHSPPPTPNSKKGLLGRIKGLFGK